MNRLLQLSVFITGLALSLVACRKDKFFAGKDNNIVSFQLSKGGTVLKAYIVNDSVVVTLPGRMSLGGAVASVVLSEHARISPDPASVTDWDSTQTFTVTSYDGMVRTYTYTLQRNIISKDGNITLMTQSDVDTLVSMGLNQINGNLTIGRPAGPDSIHSLAGLTSIKTITGDFTLNPTYTGKDLKGLDSLETVGSFLIGKDVSTGEVDPVMNLKTFSLPRLKLVQSDMILNGVGVSSIDLPMLTSVGRNLEVLNLDSLSTLELPKLANVLQSVTVQGSQNTNALQSINFPALTTVEGDIAISLWSALTSVDLPVLTQAGSFKIPYEFTITSITAPKLTQLAGGIDLSSAVVLTKLDLSALQKVGGDLELQSVMALQNLDGLKSLTSIGGRLDLNTNSALTSINGLKSLTSVGGDVLLQSLDALSDDNLDGLSALKTIGGDLNLSEVPFKKFTGFAVTQIANIKIYGSNLTTIETIDLSKLNITGQVTINGVTNGAAVKGPTILNADLLIQDCDIIMSGFGQVNNLSYQASNLSSTGPESISTQKVIGTLSVYVASGISKISLPDLTEVDGLFSLQIYTQLELDAPLLASTGQLLADVAYSNMDVLSLPQLATVNGSCSISTGAPGYSLGAIQIPKLSTVNGTLSISGPNTRITNLDGLSALTSVQGISIQNNTMLTDYTGLKNVIGGFGASKWGVGGNSYNPTYQDMVDGKYKP